MALPFTHLVLNYGAFKDVWLQLTTRTKKITTQTNIP
jgi:hypothetical protein